MENWKLHNQIKVQRAIKNLTQEELAIKIGVTRKTINTIENEKFVPSTILAIRLARFFEIKVEELFELIDNQNTGYNDAYS
jgi:putative transcriptional regulator